MKTDAEREEAEARLSLVEKIDSLVCAGIGTAAVEAQKEKKLTGVEAAYEFSQPFAKMTMERIVPLIARALAEVAEEEGLRGWEVWERVGEVMGVSVRVIDRDRLQ